MRVSGDSLDIDAIVQALPIKPYRFWRKGDLCTWGGSNGKLHTDSGACFDVSKAGMDDFEAQMEHAISFLTKYEGMLRRLACYPGVECAQLDFGIDPGSAWTRSVILSPRLLRVAADAGISVELSLYRQTDES